MKPLHSLLESFYEETTLKHGLPAAAYKDEEFWRAECASVFTRNWVCVGFVHELQAAGDAVPVTVAEHPLCCWFVTQLVR